MQLFCTRERFPTSTCLPRWLMFWSQACGTCGCGNPHLRCYQCLQCIDSGIVRYEELDACVLQHFSLSAKDFGQHWWRPQEFPSDPCQWSKQRRAFCRSAAALPRDVHCASRQALCNVWEPGENGGVTSEWLDWEPGWSHENWGKTFYKNDVTFKQILMTRSLNLFLASNQYDLFSRSGLGALSVLNQADQCKSRPISTRTYCGLTTVESYTQNDFAGWSFRKFPQVQIHEIPTNDSWLTKKPIRMGSSGMAMAYAMIVKGYTQQKARTSSWRVVGKCW